MFLQVYSVYAQLAVNQLSFYPFLSLLKKYCRICKSDRITGLFILSFNKYSLDIYYMSDIVLGAGTKIINKLDKALALRLFWHTSDRSCCTLMYKSKVRFSH